jgi:hypothetical protein
MLVPARHRVSHFNNEVLYESLQHLKQTNISICSGSSVEQKTRGTTACDRVTYLIPFISIVDIPTRISTTNFAGLKRRKPSPMPCDLCQIIDIIRYNELRIIGYAHLNRSTKNIRTVPCHGGRALARRLEDACWAVLSHNECYLHKSQTAYLFIRLNSLSCEVLKAVSDHPSTSGNSFPSVCRSFCIDLHTILHDNLSQPALERMEPAWTMQPSLSSSIASMFGSILDSMLEILQAEGRVPPSTVRSRIYRYMPGETTCFKFLVPNR